MPPGGYIVLSRKFFESWLWTEAREFSRAEAFQDLLASAAWAPYSRSINGSIVSLDRGEIVASLRFLAARWSWSVKRVRVFLAQLEKKGTARAQRETQAGHVYLLVNYDAYQSNGHSEGTGEDGGGAQRGHSEGTARAQRKGSKGSKDNESKETERDLFEVSCPTPEASNGSGRDSYSAEFLEVYAAYPRHEAKAAAWKAWKAMAKTKTLPSTAEILAAIERQKTSDGWRKDGGQYIPLLASWLRAGRWADECKVVGVSVLPKVEPFRPSVDAAGRRYKQL